MKSRELRSAMAKIARERAGSRMKNIGERRRAVVRRIISEAIEDGRRTVEGVADHLEREAGGPRDKRDWSAVALTELTDARARASLQVIRDSLGSDAIVTRTPNPGACRVCRVHFGTSTRPRGYRAASIPMALRGSVHPNCSCGPWVAKQSPALTKAMTEHADIGWVRRLKNGDCEIAGHDGGWISIADHAARSVILTVLRLAPIVVPEEQDGAYQVGRHACGKIDGPYRAVSFAKVSTQGVWVPMDPRVSNGPGFRETLMKTSKSTDDYLGELAKALPVVVTLPEFWKDRTLDIRFLTDFLGAKTLTDWHWIGRKIAPDAWLGKFHGGAVQPRGACRILVRKFLRAATLRK